MSSFWEGAKELGSLLRVKVCGKLLKKYYIIILVVVRDVAAKCGENVPDIRCEYSFEIRMHDGAVNSVDERC